MRILDATSIIGVARAKTFCLIILIPYLRTPDMMTYMAKLDVLTQGVGLRTSLGSLGLCTIALIRDGGNTLVDTGHFGTRRRVLEALGRLGLMSGDVDRVILTHSHWDHSINLELFRGAKVIISERELAHARSVRGDDWATPMSLASLLGEMRVEAVRGDCELSGDIRLIETPGHSPGHQSVLVETDGGTMLLTGDAMPTMRAYRRGLPDYLTSEAEAKRSIERLKALKPDVYNPGHDRPFRVVEGRPEYIAGSEVKIIYRNESEEDVTIVLGTESAGKPERV